MRPASIEVLLGSVRNQVRRPDQIIIVDGSKNKLTQELIAEKFEGEVTYYLVEDKDRGLTRQRNFGLSKVDPESEIISFLDDDTVLTVDYFKVLEAAFAEDEAIVGVGGVAINENRWSEQPLDDCVTNNEVYCWEGYQIKESSRNRLRNKLGLQSNLPPGQFPEFSHGRTFSYPLTGKMYPVDLLIGMSMAFRASVFKQLHFSLYFDGYGLYEDADFSLRARKLGKLMMHTGLQLEHHHEPSGRPNQYKYGRMVVRNGWYVWRVGYPKPSFKARVKWHQISLLLMLIRFTNILTGPKRMQALTESLGRLTAWIQLWFIKPREK